jgi:hypothetical protein
LGEIGEAGSTSIYDVVVKVDFFLFLLFSTGTTLLCNCGEYLTFFAIFCVIIIMFFLCDFGD